MKTVKQFKDVYGQIKIYIKNIGSDYLEVVELQVSINFFFVLFSILSVIFQNACTMSKCMYT